MIKAEITNLVMAFTFPDSDITYYFLWDKKSKKVVKISLWDYNDFEEGISINEEIENAIRNTNKNYIDIPRITIAERIQIMKDFASTIKKNSLRREIDNRIEAIIQSTIKFDVRHLRRKYLIGIDMASLTYDLSTEVVESWQTFFHDKTKEKIFEWLKSENLSM